MVRNRGQGGAFSLNSRPNGVSFARSCSPHRWGHGNDTNTIKDERHCARLRHQTPAEARPVEAQSRAWWGRLRVLRPPHRARYAVAHGTPRRPQGPRADPLASILQPQVRAGPTARRRWASRGAQVVTVVVRVTHVQMFSAERRGPSPPRPTGGSGRGSARPAKSIRKLTVTEDGMWERPRTGASSGVLGTHPGSSTAASHRSARRIA